MSHINICLKPGYDANETKQLCERKLLQWVSDNGGSISSEHGVGQIKTEYMEMVHDPNILNHMRLLKKVFDPKNILNPGKVVCDENYKL